MQTTYIVETTYAILDVWKHGQDIKDARLEQLTVQHINVCIHVGFRVLHREDMAIVCTELVEGCTSLEEDHRID